MSRAGRNFQVEMLGCGDEWVKGGPDDGEAGLIVEVFVDKASTLTESVGTDCSLTISWHITWIILSLAMAEHSVPMEAAETLVQAEATEVMVSSKALMLKMSSSACKRTWRSPSFVLLGFGVSGDVILCMVCEMV